MTQIDSPTDEALAARAARGDERAFSQLVQRHKEPLYRLLRRYTGNADEAYEAAHEAFIAAWRALGRYDPARSFGSWLRTIAINKARDRGRRMAVRRLLFGGSQTEVANVADSARPADQSLERAEALAALDRAIARLPAALKEALLLTAFDGLSQKEAGEILGVTAKTIETRVYRARRILADLLDRPAAP